MRMGPKNRRWDGTTTSKKNSAFHSRPNVSKRGRFRHFQVGEKVEVVDMALEDECERVMFVMVEWSGRRLGVPLSQLEGIRVDRDTKEALRDWQYWIGEATSSGSSLRRRAELAVAVERATVHFSVTRISSAAPLETGAFKRNRVCGCYFGIGSVTRGKRLALAPGTVRWFINANGRRQPARAERASP